MADFGKILQAFNQGGGQPGGMQPLQSPIGMPPVGSEAKDAKSQKLAMMLYALGGALKGDKNFVQNTLALQNMQEGKKKEEERKKRFNEAIEKMDPNSPLYKFATKVGSEGMDKIAEAEFDLETRQPLDASKQIKQEELRVIRKLEMLNGDIGQLSGYEKNIYDNYVKGGGNINPLNLAMAGLIGNNSYGMTPSPSGGNTNYTRTGKTTPDGKEIVLMNGKEYVLAD
jgi:hypothetical protein